MCALIGIHSTRECSSWRLEVKMTRQHSSQKNLVKQLSAKIPLTYISLPKENRSWKPTALQKLYFWYQFDPIPILLSKSNCALYAVERENILLQKWTLFDWRYFFHFLKIRRRSLSRLLEGFDEQQEKAGRKRTALQ